MPMLPSDRFYTLNTDFRAPYARDRDRVIHSKHFRKLEYKTQVFLNQEGDFFRTRLTHSLEVSQVARSIAKELGMEESLAEAIALSHDLGHTPFGHVGGDTLDHLLKEDGHTHGFEHNFQSFRVVTNIENRYKQFRGLNLTFATLEGILKHSYPYKKSFIPERIADIFRLDFHPSLEAMVVDRADEIAYMSHDIEDGINSGLISFETLKENAIIQHVFTLIEAEGVDQEDAEIFLYRFTSHFINYLVYSLIDFSKQNIPATHTILSATIPAHESIPVGFTTELETQIKKLKKILYSKLYKHPQIVKKMHSGKNCLKGLYHAFNEDVSLLPLQEQSHILEKNEHRVIADYIASMSDRYALKLYNELYGYN